MSHAANLMFFLPAAIMVGGYGLLSLVKAWSADSGEEWLERAWQSACALLLAGFFICIAVPPGPTFAAIGPVHEDDGGTADCPRGPHPDADAPNCLGFGRE